MSYKNGGTGKGSALREGLDKEKFEERMEEIRLKKKAPKCSICHAFFGFGPIGQVKCREINYIKYDTDPCVDYMDAEEYKLIRG